MAWRLARPYEPSGRVWPYCSTSRSRACAVMAYRAMLAAVAASRMRLTVWPWGSRQAQRDHLLTIGLGPARVRGAQALPGPIAQPGEHHVGAVDLVVDGAEVLADRAGVRAAGDAVVHEPGGLRLVGVFPGAGVDAQLSPQRLADRAGMDEPDQAVGEGRGLRPGGQPDSQIASRRAVTWSTGAPLASASAMPSSMRRS
jgi:hypothetical protein